MCKSAKKQFDKEPEDSAEGSQGTGGLSDSTCGWIMRRCDYGRKMEEMLGTGTYGKLRGNPTATQENRLNRKRYVPISSTPILSTPILSTPISSTPVWSTVTVNHHQLLSSILPYYLLLL